MRTCAITKRERPLSTVPEEIAAKHIPGPSGGQETIHELLFRLCDRCQGEEREEEERETGQETDRNRRARAEENGVWPARPALKGELPQPNMELFPTGTSSLWDEELPAFEPIWPRGGDATWSGAADHPAAPNTVATAAIMAATAATEAAAATAAAEGERNVGTRSQLDKFLKAVQREAVGPVTVTPLPGWAGMLKRAFLAEAVPGTTSQWRDTFRARMMNVFPELKARHWAALAVVKCLRYEEYEHRLNSEMRHCGNCDGNEPSDIFFRQRITHTIGLSPAGREKTCERCGHTEQEKPAFACYCLTAVLRLLESLMDGGVLTLDDAVVMENFSE